MWAQPQCMLGCRRAVRAHACMLQVDGGPPLLKQLQQQQLPSRRQPGRMVRSVRWVPRGRARMKRMGKS